MVFVRADMSKVLVESPRVGRSRARAHEGQRRQLRQRADRDGESAPQRFGMQRDITSHKHFGEHLGPLYRCLRQQVNRPWAKVYGELCAALDRRSVVQAHLFQHIDDKVEVDTVWRDGAVWVHGWRGGLVPLSDSRAEMFVHPRTGILLPNRARSIEVQRQRQQQRQKVAQSHADRRSGLQGMAADCQWQRIGGLWYEVTLAAMDQRDDKTRVFDVVLKRSVSGRDRQLLFTTHGRSGCYAIAKRQLDRATLRKHGLAGGFAE
jgi:hypothetical protein